MFDYRDTPVRAVDAAIPNNSGMKMRNGSPDHARPMPNMMRLAQAYVPYQRFTGILAPDKALRHGTVFEELYQPWQRR